MTHDVPKNSSIKSQNNTCCVKVNQRYFTLQIHTEYSLSQNFLFEQFFNFFLWISIKNWHFLVFKFFPLCGHSVTFNFSDDDDEKAFVLILNEL